MTMPALLLLLLAQDGGVTCHANGALPDVVCTPGKVSDETLEQVCTLRTATLRHVTMATKKAVLRAYDVKHHDAGEIEIDHLVPLTIGGTNDQENLWPQFAEPEPGYRSKDRLEVRLHSLVCSGKLSLKEAQDAIRTDWVAAFKKYVEPEVQR